MYYDEINKLPDRILSGLDTISSASAIVMTDIYFHTERYGFFPYEQDDKDDFTIYLYSTIEGLFLSYDPQRAPFSYYLYNFVKRRLNSWRRLRSKNSADEQALLPVYLQIHEETAENYDNMTEQSVELLKDPEPVYTSDSTIDISDPLWWPSGNKKNRILIILALKACFYLSEHDIFRIASQCSCSPAGLRKHIENLKSRFSSRFIQKEIFTHRRDNSYYFRRRYAYLLENRSYCPLSYKKIHNKFISQTNTWQRHNSELSRNRHRLCPTNESIAPILGICPRQISYYLEIAKKENTFR